MSKSSFKLRAEEEPLYTWGERGESMFLIRKVSLPYYSNCLCIYPPFITAVPCGIPKYNNWTLFLVLYLFARKFFVLDYLQ
jgi:hypothetical protein